MAPRQNVRKKGRTAKTGEKPTAAGTKRKKNKTKTVRGGVWPVSPELSLLKTTKNKKTTTAEKQKRERENKTQKTADLTWREFFGPFSGAKNQTIEQKPKQNTIEEHTRSITTPKTEVRSRKMFSNSDCKKRRTTKKRQGSPNQTRKTQKNGQHFPLRDGAERANICMTVRSVVSLEERGMSCPPTFFPTDALVHLAC